MEGEYLGRGWAARRVGILRAPGEAVDVAVTVQGRLWFPRWAVLQVNRSIANGAIISTVAVLEEGRSLLAISAAARAVVAGDRWRRHLRCRRATDAETPYPLPIDRWSQQGG